MAVTINLSKFLRRFAAGQTQVEIDGSPTTVGDALESLWSRYPGIRDRMVDDQGEMRPLVRVFVGNQNVRFAQGLATPLLENGEIHIAPTKE